MESEANHFNKINKINTDWDESVLSSDILKLSI